MVVFLISLIHQQQFKHLNITNSWALMFSVPSQFTLWLDSDLTQMDYFISKTVLNKFSFHVPQSLIVFYHSMSFRWIWTEPIFITIVTLFCYVFTGSDFLLIFSFKILTFRIFSVIHGKIKHGIQSWPVPTMVQCQLITFSMFFLGNCGILMRYLAKHENFLQFFVSQ